MTALDELQEPEGCRIINLSNLKDFTKNISEHSAVCGGEVVLNGEIATNGLASILVAQCRLCNLKIDFPTSSKASGITGNKRWECNLSAVWGQMATGGGYNHLQESLGSLGVPVLWKSFDEAAAEEKKLAIERGSFHDGVPAITVIVDGGWSKRSHKHSYNAKSGVAIISGTEAGKLLYLGVRNKYCGICTQAERIGKDPQEHDCNKNWDEPSSSMETDILVEGFKQAELRHGIRYIQFIGDGDSSVYPSLLTQVPVWGHAIRKMECANHAVKCYRSALENLVKEKPLYKGKGKLTESMRKRLTKAARCALKMRSKEKDKTKAIQFLQDDLYNGPLHCFGDHKKCKPDYCKIKIDELNTASHPLNLHPAQQGEIGQESLLGDDDDDALISEVID
uniref:Mutator-like transposase domain-containing protein n=1 Tax=Amphimedon queenslandica TaxID=400682 RepID=A0A1X7VKX9_AMPQE